MKQWTQDEAIAFECAREVITDMMAIWSARIAEESTREFPNKIRLLEMRTSRSNLAKERVALRVLDHGEISRIRDEYGAIVRAWRVEHHAVAV